MATYTIDINENSKAGKKLLDFLKSLSDVVSIKPQKISSLDEAIEEMETGKTTKCNDYNDYLKKSK